VPPRVKLPLVVTVPVSVMPLTVPVPPTLVTVPVFDTKHMIISLWSDPSEMKKRTLQKGIMC
jgi:hypothetical protein